MTTMNKITTKPTTRTMRAALIAAATMATLGLGAAPARAAAAAPVLELGKHALTLRDAK